jgi:hypothetical protein
MFREQMPNNSTFIILGEHGFLNRLQYEVQPRFLMPLSMRFQGEYGLLHLKSYADPLFDDNPEPEQIFL